MGKQFENQYLDAFCDEISDERQLNQSSFLQLYDHGITHFTKYLKEEILNNLSDIVSGKELHYIKYVNNKITNTPYFNIDESIIDKWLVKFDVQIKDFPFQDNKQVSQYLRVRHDAFYTDKSLSFDVWDLQLEFYVFACKKEAEKIINFTNGLVQQQKGNKSQNNNSSNSNNDSVHYVKNICVRIKEFNNLKLNLFNIDEKYNEETLKKGYNEKDLQQLKTLKKEISQNLNYLHKASLNDNYFYPDCPFTVFVDNFQENIKSNIDLASLKFYKGKYGFYKFLDINRFLAYKNESYYYHQFIENSIVDYNHIQNEKIYFFEERIRRLGSTPDIIRLKTPKDEKNITSSDKEKLNLVLKKIIDQIKNFDSRMSNYNSELEYNHNAGIDDDISLDIKIDDLYEDASYHVTKGIEELQKISLKENYYFFDCPFDVYLHHYQKRKEDFLENYVDIDESDFIKAELESRLDLKNQRYFILNEDKYYYNDIFNQNRSFVASEKKKIEFLESCLAPLGWDANLIKDENNSPLHYEFKKNQNYGSPFKDVLKLVSKVRRDLARNPINKEKDNINNTDIPFESTPSTKTSKNLDTTQDNIKRHKTIFTSKEGEDIFLRALDCLNALDENGKFKWGGIAKANAVFKNERFLKKYLIYDCKEKDFIKYLNKQFDIPKNTKKLSKGDIHEFEASRFINELIKE